MTSTTEHNAHIRWRCLEGFTDASDDTGHLGAQVATVHRCSQTLTYGHPSDIWQPGTTPLDSHCEQGLRQSSPQPPQTHPKVATSMGDIPDKATWEVFCKTVGLAYDGSNPSPATTCGNSS